MNKEQWQIAIDKCIELKTQGKGNLLTDGLATRAEMWPATRDIVSYDKRVIRLLEEYLCV